MEMLLAVSQSSKAVKDRWLRNHPEKRIEVRHNYYARNRDKYKGYVGNRREFIRAMIREARNQPCTDCNVQFPWYIMEFDHARGVKEFGISVGAVKYGIEKVRAEMKKCDIVCRNCHGDRTYRRARKGGAQIRLRSA